MDASAWAIGVRQWIARALKRAIFVSPAGDGDPAEREFPTRRAIGKVAGLFYLSSALGVFLTALLPTPSGANRLALLSDAALGLVIGAFGLLAPWDRWPKRASLWLVPPAFGLIAFGTTYGGPAASASDVFFVVVFAWIGIGHGPWVSLRFAPLAVVAFVAPYTVTRSALSTEIVSASLTIFVSVMVGEAWARVVGRLGHAEQQGRQSERRFRSLVQNASDAIVVADRRGVITYASPAAATTFDAGPNLVGTNIFSHIQLPDRGPMQSAVEEFLAGAAIGPGLTVRTASSREPRWLEVAVANLLADDSVNGLVFNVRDVTEKRRAEREVARAFARLREVDRQRQSLLARLVSAQEEERHRIASDIHDDPLQKLVAVAMWLEAVRSGERVGDEEMAMLQDAVRQAVEHLRHLMFELRPYALDRGLVAGLRQFLQQRASWPGSPRYRLKGSFRSEPLEETRVLLYRIAQEALSNVWKHARASHVDVTLEEPEPGVFTVRIEDDGIGFDMDQDLPRPGHLGLSTMGQRTELAGGRFRIHSEPGKGTTVECSIPEKSREEVRVP